MARRNPAFDGIKRHFSEMSPGAVAFDVPKEMRIDVTSLVVLRLAPKGKNIGEIEHVTPIMEAHLDGDELMNVSSLRPAEQSVAGGRYAEWQWNVRPNRSGKQRLIAIVIAHLRIYDHDERQGVLTLTRDVNVKATLLDFFKDHWILYLVVIIVGPMVWSLVGPLAKALWETFRERKDPQQE